MQLGTKISWRTRSLSRSSRRGRLKEGLIEGHDHAVLRNHLYEIVRTVDTVLLQDDLQNIVITRGRVFSMVSSNGDVEDILAAQDGVKSNLYEQSGFTQSGPGHDQAELIAVSTQIKSTKWDFWLTSGSYPMYLTSSGLYRML